MSEVSEPLFVLAQIPENIIYVEGQSHPPTQRLFIRLKIRWIRPEKR